MTLYRLVSFRLRLWRGIAFASAIVFVSLCCFRAHSRRVQTEARETEQAAVRERVVVQVEPLCRALLPKEDTLRFLLTPYRVPTRIGATHNGFAIDCLDAANEQRVHLFWDDDTRRCFRISVVPVPAHRNENLPLRGASRPVRGSAWMCRLGMISDQEARESRAAVEKIASVEITRLYLPGRMAIVWTDRHTGELRQAAVYPYPGVTEMQASGRPHLPAPPDA